MAKTQAERMAEARKLAVDMVAIPEGTPEIDVAKYVLATEAGLVTVKFTAVKDPDYDVEQAVADYQFQIAEAKTKADKRKADADAKKAVDLAKKAKAKADKEKVDA